VTHRPDCWCCSRIIKNGTRRRTPAVARWTFWHGDTEPLCKACLDHWFDNADDDPSLEPAAWHWLTA
jgi:hypothetical protein